MTESAVPLLKHLSDNGLIAQEDGVNSDTDTFDVNSHSVSSEFRSRQHREVLRWLENDVCASPPQKSKCIQNSILTFEILSAAGRASIFFMLGFDFIRDVHVKKPGNTILASIYGGGTFVPMFMLGKRTMHKIIAQLLDKKSSTEKSIEFNSTFCERSKKYFAHTMAGIAGLITAPTLTYVAYDEYNNLIGYGWLLPGIPTFYVRTFIDYYSILTLSNMMYNGVRKFTERRFAKTHPDCREDITTKIRAHLENSRLFIESLSNNQAKQLLREFTREREEFREIDNGNMPLSKITYLLNPQSFFGSSEEVAAEDKTVENIVGILGGLVGAYGNWIYYSVSQDSFSSTFSFLGVDQNHPLINGFAAASTITSSALTVMAARSSAIKFYKTLSYGYKRVRSFFKPNAQTRQREEEEDDKRYFWKRFGSAALSSAFGAFFAGVQAEVVIKYVGNLSQIAPRVNMVAAVAAQFSTSFWAVDEVFLEYLEISDPRSPLLKRIDRLIEKLFHMNDESLISLNNLIQISKLRRT